jgi:hypothetical protein
MIKKISALFFTILTLNLLTLPVYAHGVLSSKTQTVGEYQIEHAVTADESSIYANYPISHGFKLASKDGSQDIRYESSGVIFSKKDGDAVFRAQLNGSNDFSSVTQLDAAMPTPGAYTAKIIFNLPKDAAGESKEVMADFDFTVVEDPFSSNESPTEAQKSKELPGYALAAIGLIGGVLLGRFGNKLFGFLKNQE